MSYILDAVKRAEAERERGAVPGLNARQMTSSIYLSYPRSQNSIWLAIIATLTVLAMAVAIWLWRNSTSATPSSPVAASVMTPPKASTPMAARPASPAPIAAVIPFQSVPQPARPPVFPLAIVKTTPSAEPKTTPPRKAEVVAKPVPQPLPPPPTLAKSVPQAVPATPVVQSPSGGIPMLNELPENIRRQIPALNMSGAIHSESPQAWTLLINDQVLAQGSQVTPDIRLEEISETSAVFNFRGQRFRINH